MNCISQLQASIWSLPPCGGSGLKFFCFWYAAFRYVRLPPCGGSGLKLVFCRNFFRRVCRLPPCGGSGLKWENDKFEIIGVCLPPCGGSGLKSSASCSMEMFLLSPSMRREWIEMYSLHGYSRDRSGLPPCGGSGLKYLHGGPFRSVCRSPSMRREWIEICPKEERTWEHTVSLHAEGVD